MNQILSGLIKGFQNEVIEMDFTIVKDYIVVKAILIETRELISEKVFPTIMVDDIEQHIRKYGF